MARREMRLWLALLDRLEFQLKLKVASGRNSFIRGTAAAYVSNGGTAPNYMLESHRRNLQKVLENHYRVCVSKFGDLALRGIKSRKIEVKDLKDAYQTFLDEWVRTQALKKATSISATDMDDVRNAIQDGIEDSAGIEDIGRRIRSVAELTPSRAATVARTETHAAATFGSIEATRQAEDELGIQLLKEWLPTLDDRTREAHRAMEGQPPIPLGEKFNVGGEFLDRPGDPSGSAENVINCRCGLAYSQGGA